MRIQNFAISKMHDAFAVLLFKVFIVIGADCLSSKVENIDHLKQHNILKKKVTHCKIQLLTTVFENS